MAAFPQKDLSFVVGTALQGESLKQLQTRANVCDVQGAHSKMVRGYRNAGNVLQDSMGLRLAVRFVFHASPAGTRRGLGNATAKTVPADSLPTQQSSRIAPNAPSESISLL